MSDKYFYVVMRDGQIVEIQRTESAINAILKAMTDKGMASILSGSLILNGVDISKMLSEEQYDDYVKSVKPKEYIKNGVWYDGKENGILRYAKWRQEQIDAIEKIESEKRDIPGIPNGLERVTEIMRRTAQEMRAGKRKTVISKKYMPTNPSSDVNYV